MEKILLTRAGYEKLIRELEFLSQVERPQVVRDILEAAQEGRVEKNPDFQSALVQRRQLERRIRQLQQTLANAEVLVGSNLSADKVRSNARVKVVNLNTGQERSIKWWAPWRPTPRPGTSPWPRLWERRCWAVPWGTGYKSRPHGE